MKYALLMATLASLVGASTGVGQDRAPLPVLGGADVQVGWAGLEWYVGSYADTSRIPYETVVLTSLTSGEAGPPPGRAWTPHRIPLPHSELSRIHDSAGVPVRVCDDGRLLKDKKDVDLCGIPKPWVWLAVSNPWVSGDSAEVIIQGRYLAPSPAGAERRIRYLAVHLRRSEGRWTVTSAHRFGTD